jgi:rod shape-determining protein MreC
MLWNQIHRFKEFGSLIFCVGFSISALVWNSSVFVQTVANANRVTDVFSSSLDGFGNFFKEIFSAVKSNQSLRKDKASYEKLIEEYKSLPHDLEVLKKENEALRKELGFKLSKSHSTVKAEVLSVRLNTIYRTIVIGKGKKDGVLPFMPVVSRTVAENGEVVPALVGKVVTSNQNTAVVQPIINSNFSMGVQIPGLHFWAVLSGNSGKGALAILSYVDSAIIINPNFSKTSAIGPVNFSDKDFSSVGIIGKTVYSSGGGGLFPPGLPVGVIVEEGPRTGSFKSAYVQPLAKLSEIQFVTVIKKLPEKWTEVWPEEKSIPVESPFYGELDFPGEELEKEKPKETKPTPEKKKELPQKNIPKKDSVEKPKAKPKEEDKNRISPDSDEDFLLKELQGGDNE